MNIFFWRSNKGSTGAASDESEPRNWLPKLISAAPAIIALVAIGAAVYFYNQAAELKKNPQKAAAQEAEEVVARVGKLIVLPEGEQPTVATVFDLEKLKDQPFFTHAKVGDKVLIYPNSKKAILYNPLENKIIEVAPINW